jgi:hypothetical protein
VQRFEVGDDLPAALRGQSRPGRHSAPEIAVAKEPGKLARSGVLYRGQTEIYCGADSASVRAVALGTMLQEELFSRAQGSG